MQLKKYNLAIINRSFWPANQIIGESLLQLGEKTFHDGKSVVVITQSSKSLKKVMIENNRGLGVTFKECKSRSDSSSNLLCRIFDALIFMFWIYLETNID